MLIAKILIVVKLWSGTGLNCRTCTAAPQYIYIYIYIYIRRNICMAIPNHRYSSIYDQIKTHGSESRKVGRATLPCVIIHERSILTERSLKPYHTKLPNEKTTRVIKTTSYYQLYKVNAKQILLLFFSNTPRNVDQSVIFSFSSFAYSLRTWA